MTHVTLDLRLMVIAYRLHSLVAPPQPTRRDVKILT